MAAAAAAVSLARAWLIRYRSRATRSVSGGKTIRSRRLSNSRSVAAASLRSAFARTRSLRSRFSSGSKSASSRRFPAFAITRYLAASARRAAPVASPPFATVRGADSRARADGPAARPAPSSAAQPRTAAAARWVTPDRAMTAIVARPAERRQQLAGPASASPVVTDVDRPAHLAGGCQSSLSDLVVEVAHLRITTTSPPLRPPAPRPRRDVAALVGFEQEPGELVWLLHAPGKFGRSGQPSALWRNDADT